VREHSSCNEEDNLKIK